MRVVALISGGKDSCFNMMHCVKNGHEIVALAHLKPAGKDELDSYMYQTVGHNIIELYAEALDLPLFQRTIVGSSVCTNLIYIKHDGDEVEDLYELLKEVKSNIDFNAVSSGAILSNYQRIRVENVCSRLGLQSLAYLWQRKQEELLDEMIHANLEAILIKVAALGLKPKAHLGKKLHELAPYLHEMNQKYELNVCGEGGEYETITLDCPLFLKRIVIDEKDIIIHSDDAFAAVGYLSFKKMHLEAKNMDPNTNLFQRMSTCNLLVPKLFQTGMIEYFPPNSHEESNVIFNDSNVKNKPAQLLEKYGEPQFFTLYSRAWVTEVVCIQDDKSIEEATMATMHRLKELLNNNHFSMSDISLIHVFCSSMKNFMKINSVYKDFFVINPPARVCVEVPLPGTTVFKMDVHLDQRNEISKNALHVQSISYWAPANIGPYSQVISVSNQAYFSGSIGMDPSSLTVIKGGLQKEASLSLHHVNEVSKVFIPNRKFLKDYGLVNCYVVEQSKEPLINDLFNCQKMFDPSRYLLNIVTVPSLPKDALVEWHVVSRWAEQTLDDTSIYGDDVFKFNIDFFKLIIMSTDFENNEKLFDVFLNYFNHYSYVLKKAEFMRIFYLHHIFNMDEESNIRNIFNSSFKSMLDKLPAASFVPVLGLEKNAFIVITGSTAN